MKTLPFQPYTYVSVLFFVYYMTELDLMFGVTAPELQEAKTFRIARFLLQKLSG